ncbi:MAG: VOC family protein [Gammaproteobacteria bacterium]|nr:VOC family protein [Gammaproteobacteria bacterium]MDH5727972.1 VOC family protein [Gammaproteobacteria bacterium]
MQRPEATRGLRHVALYVKDLAACEQFYCELMGMHVEWRPDADNVYLSGGNDNLALHKASELLDVNAVQKLDHIGFILATPRHVDDWFVFLQAQGVEIRNPPRTHRDGARSFYCYDPDKTVVQMIYHPPISDK